MFKRHRKKRTPSLTEQDILEAFEHSADIAHRKIFIHNGLCSTSVLLLHCEGLCHVQQLNDEIIPELEKIFSKPDSNKLSTSSFESMWKKYPLTVAENINQVITAVFDGQLLLIIEHLEAVYLINIVEHPQRNPEETRTEVSVRGARDGFIEELRINTALIRRRMRSNSLRYEEWTIGRRSQTKVGLFFIEDIVSQHVIREVRAQLEKIDIDALLTSNQLEELLIPAPLRLFPMFQYTGRPDFAAEALLNGRFVLLVDGNPTVLIAPVGLSFLLKSGEDNNTFFFYNSIERLIRTIGLLLATLLPGFWVALGAFHQNQIPFTLLTSLAQIRQGIPLPLPLEAFIMIIIFELFREAGLRLPASIGQTLSVVGGLIIGDAAIRAGLTSPATVVIIATSAVATFALVNQSLGGTISILRIYILAFSSFLGLFGFLVASFSLLLYLANIRSYGTPYLLPWAPFQWNDLINSVLRPSWQQRKSRPSFTQQKDSDRQGGEND